MQDFIPANIKKDAGDFKSSAAISSEVGKANYTLHLADTNLVLAQRNAEWCAHGPILEQDIAITNISLDLLGQARNFYQYAAMLINQASNEPDSLLDEDKLAYLRTEREFKNLMLVELPNGDWAQTILRQYLFSQYQYIFYTKLQSSQDRQIAAIATKSLKETKYHLRWSSEWVIRLGDGTDESKQRITKAIAELWPYTGEMFVNAVYENEMFKEDIAVDCSLIKHEWTEKVKVVFEEATLSLPENIFLHTGGKEGIHTEHLGFILSDLQYLQRTYPNSEW